MEVSAKDTHRFHCYKPVVAEFINMGKDVQAVPVSKIKKKIRMSPVSYNSHLNTPSVI